MKSRATYILPVIIFSQFAGGSLWFSGNAILSDLMREWSISIHAVGYITSAVQLGFIIGTLIIAFCAIADRFSPRKIFFYSSVAGAVANSLILILPHDLSTLLLLRFVTGCSLAGIYPIGMKIAAGWYRQGLGRALGYMVGALVLGTAFPHVLKALGYQLDWQMVLATTSLIAFWGGSTLLLLVPDGPYTQNGTLFRAGAIFSLLKTRDVREAALGYWGHMWELYTLWTFLPLFLSGYVAFNSQTNLNIPLWSFGVIGCGLIGCVAGGIVSQRRGSARVAFVQLGISGMCCLLSPLLYHLSPWLFLSVMVIWGITVAGDSPQYSAIIAQAAPQDQVGSTLTLVNCIGFLITIISIQFLDWMSYLINIDKLLILLLPGPLLGVYSMRSLISRRL